jgi:hypothetical protein
MPEDPEIEWMRDTIALLRAWVQEHDTAIAEIRDILSRPRGGQKI